MYTPVPMSMEPVYRTEDGYADVYRNTETGEYYLVATCTGIAWSTVRVKLDATEVELFLEDPEYAETVGLWACKEPSRFEGRVVSQEDWERAGGQSG
jgi:hypothetical protein